MRSAYRVTSILLFAITQRITATQSLGAGQMVQKADPISVFSQLKTTLSKLYPIEHWTVSTTPDVMHPFAPRFCWGFFRPDAETLARLREGIRNYKGSVIWIFGPPEANAPICLVAAKPGRNQFVGYPPFSRPEDLFAKEGMEPESIPTAESIDQAVADVPNLCSHLERYLKLEGMPAKAFDSGWIAPRDPPSLESSLVDFVEQGMHVASIVHQGTSSGSNDWQMLHFSVAEDELREIHTNILDNSSPGGQ